MKRNSLHRYLMLIPASVLISALSHAQIENIDFLRSAPADGAKLLEAYVTPWVNAFGAGLNGSWYNTAKPHKWTGFDITLGLNVGMVPSSSETFDISSLGLSTAISGTGAAPTIAGPKNEGPLMTYSQSGVTLASFNTPPGTDWKYIPVPTLQIGFGLPLGTELKGRFVPRLPVKDGDIMLWGAGLMHSITQYVRGDELLPFDISVFGGYTWLRGNVPLTLLPDPELYPYAYSDFDPQTSFLGQNLRATVTAWNAGAIGSVNLKVITFYAGLGYSDSRTVIDLEGFYPTPVLMTPGGIPSYAEYTDDGVISGEDFPDVDIRNFSGLRVNVGFRLKLSVFTFHVDYTRAQYNVISTGIGLSFR